MGGLLLLLNGFLLIPDGAAGAYGLIVLGVVLLLVNVLRFLPDRDGPAGHGDAGDGGAG